MPKNILQRYKTTAVCTLACIGILLSLSANSQELNLQEIQNKNPSHRPHLDRIKVDLNNFAPELQNRRNCAVEIIANEKKLEGEYTATGPNHQIQLPVQSDYTGDARLIFKGPDWRIKNNTACQINLEISYSELKKKLWEEWQSNNESTVIACVKNNLSLVGLKFPNNNFTDSPIPMHSMVSTLKDACTIYQGITLQRDIPCSITSDILKGIYNGKCENKLIDQFDNRIIYDDERSIISAILLAKKIVKIQVETSQSKQARTELEKRHIAELAAEARKAELIRQEEAKKIAEAKKAEEEKKRIIDEQRAKEIAAAAEQKRKWEESPEGKKAIAEKIAKEKLAAEREETERKKNFLLGLCEIPSKSDLDQCSRDAIAKLDDTAGSYWYFTQSYVNFVVMSTNKIPNEYRIDKSFSAYVTYEVDEKNATVIAHIWDDKNRCVTDTTYKKTLLGIKVIVGNQSGSCSETQKQLYLAREKEYKMKFRKYEL